MNMHHKDAKERVVRVFQNGRSRAVRIPKEWEFEGDTVIMSQIPDGTLLIRPGETSGLVDYLRSAEPWTGGDFVDDDRSLPPLDEPQL